MPSLGRIRISSRQRLVTAVSVVVLLIPRSRRGRTAREAGVEASRSCE